MKKFFAALICACLVLGCLSGCASENVSDYTEPTAEASAEATAAASHDFDTAFALYDADTVVMTIDGSDVTWDEFFYWNYYTLSYIESYIGTVSLSDTCMFDDTMTYGEYVLTSALSYLKQYHALEVNLAANGVELSDASKDSISSQLKSDTATYCGEEATEEDFTDYLLTLYVTPEVYNYVNTVAALYSDGMTVLYGEDGSKLTDDEVLAWADENGYMRAKHILISTTDDEGAALDDEAKAEKLAEAQAIYDQLSTITDKEKLEAKFDELMNENSDDTGLAYYPDGYCFTSGKMVEAFETAVTALDDFGLSEIVESDYGYHIILRLPLEADSLVEYNSADEQYSLRYVAASGMYSDKIDEWVANAEVVWAKDFEGFSLADVIKDA